MGIKSACYLIFEQLVIDDSITIHSD